MKREYTYTYHVVIEDGEVIDYWCDEESISPREPVGVLHDYALERYRDEQRAAREVTAEGMER